MSASSMSWCRPLRTASGVVACLVGVLALQTGPAAQGQARKQLFISVQEQDGTPVPDLMPGDVTVSENQVPGKTLKVEPIRWPVKLTVLVDNGSAASSYLAELRAGLTEFFKQLPDGVEASVVTLAPQPRLLLKPTTSMSDALKSVGFLTPGAAARVGVPMGTGPAPGSRPTNPNLPNLNSVSVAAGVMFFDGLAEAAARVEKERGDYFPVFLMITSDIRPDDAPLDRDVQRLVKRVRDYGVTVHFVMVGLRYPGGLQANLGGALTKVSSGRYENIAIPSKLVTLLPEFGQQIARSHFRQSHQYRVTYEPPPGNANEPKTIAVGIVAAKSGASSQLTIDGRLP